MFTATITPPNGGESYRLTADSRDVVEWELADHKRYMGLLQQRTSMSAIGQLLWCAARREGRFGGTEREFITTHVIDLQDSTEDDEVGPTHPVP
jgi:hypothetical protein